MKPIKPILSGLEDDTDWDACEAYENAVYNYVVKLDGAVSDDRFDELIAAVHAAFDEYYRLYEN